MPVAGDLVLEDGTGIEGANAYIDIGYADTYHALRSNTLWGAATESDRVASIVLATDYVDYRWAFVGRKLTAEQGLDWPRYGAIGADGILYTDVVPEPVKRATAEYALRVLGDGSALVNLAPDPETDPSGRFVTLKREKLGPLEEETRYSANRVVQVLKPYPVADRILRASGLIAASGRTVRA